MTITMNISHIRTVDQMQTFLNDINEEITLSAKSKEDIYKWINNILSQVKYRNLPKRDKSITKNYIQKITGYSNIQIKRFIAKHKQGQLKWIKWQKADFNQIYSREDIELLHQVDEEHRLSGKATKTILQREFGVFGDERFRKLANISVSHIYNLRNSKQYFNFGRVFDKTKSVISNIGVRTKPNPNGQPGYLRVDTVHQGDKDSEKGIYHINIVDEITQSEFIYSVKAISSRYLKEVLKNLYRNCYFKIINFHSDNGSEFINEVVADLLNDLHISQTKSRPRKHNDNALVETKNGSVVRKHFGYAHIPATDHNASLLTNFCIQYLNPYLNFHRPCGFPTTITDKKGKQRKNYKQEDYKTPYEKFKSLPNAYKYLKKGITFDRLDKIAYNLSDTEFANKMNKAKKKIYKLLEL